ncbi:hypothetical protein AB205_0164430 [Aquarana catesbeiana]|uniref:NR LBD domain-containing protein n=1 Tax=Aquarana catesbeiana TaxID=8400 RepID=A0A2G9RD76_AQUCT|nr:hypothetical protein AB205_0164430 [Aquarana catesbeiana]
MSDEAVKIRRALIKKKRRLVQFQSTSPNPGLTEEQRLLVEQLAEAQKMTFDSNFAHFNNFRVYRPGVTDRENIDRIQEHLALTLMSHIEAERQSQEYRFLFAKIMECLTEMRTVSDEHSKQVLHIWDIQPGYTPLLLEVFSKVNDE